MFPEPGDTITHLHLPKIAAHPSSTVLVLIQYFRIHSVTLLPAENLLQKKTGDLVPERLLRTEIDLSWHLFAHLLPDRGRTFWHHWMWWLAVRIIAWCNATTRSYYRDSKQDKYINYILHGMPHGQSSIEALYEQLWYTHSKGLAIAVLEILIRFIHQKDACCSLYYIKYITLQMLSSAKTFEVVNSTLSGPDLTRIGWTLKRAMVSKGGSGIVESPCYFRQSDYLKQLNKDYQVASDHICTACLPQQGKWNYIMAKLKEKIMPSHICWFKSLSTAACTLPPVLCRTLMFSCRSKKPMSCIAHVRHRILPPYKSGGREE